MRLRSGFVFIFLLALSWGALAQSYRLSVKRGKAQRFARQIVESVLVVPIGDEKDPEEKALMDAVKKYWKVSKFEFVAGKDFEKVYEANTKDQKNCMYLVSESYDRRKTRKKDWSFTKYYISVNPSFVELWGDPLIQFKIPVKATDKENAEPVKADYFYGMMMKHMNREVLYMQDPDKYGKVSKHSLYKSTFKGKLAPYADRDVLVSRKELDNFMMNLPEYKKTPAQEEKFKDYLVKKLKVDRTKIRFVSDDEVKKAVASENKKVLIYTGFSLFRAEDMGMLRRIDPHRSARIASNIIFTISLLVCVAGFMVALNYF